MKDFFNFLLTTFEMIGVLFLGLLIPSLSALSLMSYGFELSTLNFLLGLIGVEVLFFRIYFYWRKSVIQ